MGVMQTVAKIGMALASSFASSDHNPLSTANLEKHTPTPVMRSADVNLANTYFVSTGRQDGVPQDGAKQEKSSSGIKYREPTKITYREPTKITYREPTKITYREPTNITPLPPTQIVPSAPTQIIPAQSSYFSTYNYGNGVPYYQNQNNYYGNQFHRSPLNYQNGYSQFGQPYGYRPRSVQLGFPMGDGYMFLYNNRGVPGVNFSAPGFNYNTSPFGSSFRIRGNNGLNFSTRGW